MTIKALHIRSSIGMYGAEQVIVNISNTAKKFDLENQVFIIEGRNPEASGLRSDLLKKSHNVEYFISRSKLDFNVVKKIRGLVKNVELVHTHDYKSLILASIALTFTSVKIVHHVHGSLGNTRSEKIYAFLESIFMRNASKIITVSDAQKKSLVKKLGLKNKIIQINNGTKISSSEPYRLKEEEVFTIIMAARFTPEKNHFKALDVLYDLERSGYSVELVCLGAGPELERIKKYTNDLNLSSKVRFVGFTREVSSWINSSNLMLFTSTTEGLPISMLEAMACGLPIVSTPVGEIPKILSESEGGWIANTTNEISSQIGFLINNREVLLIAGKKGFEYAKNKLSIESQLSKILSVYREVTEDTN